MFYSPHTIEKKVLVEERDEFGRLLESVHKYVEIGKCRCDDGGEAQYDSSNGESFIPSYHVVCDNIDVKAGDEVRMMKGDVIRGEGRVRKVRRTNYYDYTEIWI